MPRSPVQVLLLIAAVGAAGDNNTWTQCANATGPTACDGESTCCRSPFSKTNAGCCPWKDAVCCPGNPWVSNCCPKGSKCVNTGDDGRMVTTCVVDVAQNKTVPGKAVCKPGAEQELSTTLPNIIMIGDSVSIGYTTDVARMMKGEALVQHSPYAGDGGAEEAAYGLQCLPYFLRTAQGTPLEADIVTFNWGLHDGPLGNRTDPGQQEDPSKYREELTQIATQMKATLPSTTKLLFLLTSPDMCSETSDGCVRNLNNQAREVMASLGIPTLDIYTPILQLCGGSVPNATCLGLPECFCPHCRGPGYEFMANTTIVPKLRSML